MTTPIRCPTCRRKCEIWRAVNQEVKPLRCPVCNGPARSVVTYNWNQVEIGDRTICQLWSTLRGFRFTERERAKFLHTLHPGRE